MTRTLDLMKKMRCDLCNKGSKLWSVPKLGLICETCLETAHKVWEELKGKKEPKMNPDSEALDMP